MTALRAVKPGEVAPSRRPLTIVEAVKAGDRLAELEAIHRRIAGAVQDEATPARDLASLTRRQLEVSREIDALKHSLKEEADENAVSEDEVWSEEVI